MDKFKKAIEQLNKPDSGVPVKRPKRENGGNGREKVVVIKRENTAIQSDPKPADAVSPENLPADTAAKKVPVDTAPAQTLVIDETPSEEVSADAAPEEKNSKKSKKKAIKNEKKAIKNEKKAIKNEKKKQTKLDKKRAKNKQPNVISNETDIENGTAEETPAKKRKGLVTVIIFAVIALAIAGCFANIHLNNQLRPVFYQMRSSKVVDNVRIVAVSDMHLKEFGENNIRLVDKIKSYHPDIIAIVGDMNIDKNPDYSAVMNLCARLNNVAPLYYSLGNHEFEAMLFDDSQIYYDLKAAGVKVLNNETETVEVGLSTIDIIGLTQSPKSYREYGEKFFDKAMNTGENFKLVLTHYPELFDGYIEDYPIDLAISGHAHGGQVRLPFIGGLYSSDQGIFPRLCDGMHEIGNSTLVVSKGLGRSGLVPRINNPPEITIIDINWY